MSPKSKEQFAAERQRSMDAIKQAALELFAEKGYQNTSISDIAKGAGISKGLMYNYFESKEELLRAILEEAMREGDALMAMLADPGGDPYEQLRAITYGSIQMVKSNLTYWKFLTSLAFQSTVLKSLEPLLKRQREEATAIAVKLFERMGRAEPLHEAYLFAASLDGLFLYFMVLEDEFPLEEMAEFLLRKLTTHS